MITLDIRRPLAARLGSRALGLLGTALVALMTLFAGAPGAALAQPVASPTLTVTPATPASNEQVTIRVDAAGTFFEGADIYLWAWLPNVGDAPSNGQWGESTDAARFRNVGGTIYEKTFVPSEYFGRTAADFRQAGDRFGYLIKLRNGDNGKTEDQFVRVSPPVFVVVPLRMIPASATQRDVVTFVFDPAHPDVPEALRGQTDLFAYIATAEVVGGQEGDLISPVGYDQVPGNNRVALKQQAGGTYYVTIYPRAFFGLSATSRINALYVKIRSRDGSLSFPAEPGPARDALIQYRLAN